MVRVVSPGKFKTVVCTVLRIGQFTKRIFTFFFLEQRNPGGDQQDEVPHDPLQLDLNGVLLVEPGPPVELPNSQMMPGPTQAVVVTSTQPPPQPYSAHPTITTLAPLGRTNKNHILLSYTEKKIITVTKIIIIFGANYERRSTILRIRILSLTS